MCCIDITRVDGVYLHGINMINLPLKLSAYGTVTPPKPFFRMTEIHVVVVERAGIAAAIHAESRVEVRVPRCVAVGRLVEREGVRGCDHEEA